MNRRSALATLGAGALTVATGRICLPEQAAGHALHPVPLSIQEALRLAEAYVQKHSLSGKDRHIVSAILHPQTPREQASWVITWNVTEPVVGGAKDTVVKGGWFALRVRADKSIQAIYGK